MLSAVEQLEQEFALWLDAPGAVATGFGRSALYLALLAAGVEGGEVAVPDFICAQVPDAVRRAGARPAYYRVGRDLTVAAEDLRIALGPATRAAILPHYFGRALTNVPELVEACHERGIVAVEDCALALGAGGDGQRAGTFGDLAVFSFTKSDWCYGGGMVAAPSADVDTRLRRIRDASFAPVGMLSFSYGLLRRADFLANRPTWSATAERAGRWIERLARYEESNFYDAGLFDATMPGFAARRARNILEHLADDTECRRTVRQELLHRLETRAHLWVRPGRDEGDAASFLVLQSPGGRSRNWVREAARHGVTLRHCWPAYQEAERWSEDLAWLAEHLLLLEIHPRTTPKEAEDIASCVDKLAVQEESQR